MRTLVVTFTVLVILLSLVASLAGSLSHGLDREDRHHSTWGSGRGRGREYLPVQRAGAGDGRDALGRGTPSMGIPVLLVSFIFHLRRSLRGTVLFVGSLANFLYQYLLWTFDWAFNSLFLGHS